MRHTHFKIGNFKGIVNARFDFCAHPRSNVYTLVGLNESGKTTVLQALNFLSYKPETLDPLNLPGYSIKDVHDLIPISRRANFNDKLVVTAGYEPDNDEQVAIAEFLRRELKFTLCQHVQPFHITQSYPFVDSKFTTGQPGTEWSIEFCGRKKGGKIDRELDGEDWKTAVNFVKTMLPSVLYFPNFLFEFPDRIYLEGNPPDGEASKHDFYRTVLQDVLDSMGDGTNLEKHVLNRAKSDARSDKAALDSVLLKMGSQITSTVFRQWDQIFKRVSASKEIMVGVDHDEQNQVFVRLRLKDASEMYEISERSLGFRWFFAFLLLTQFRGFRKGAPKNVLFLLDEPASNLHPSAQAQLLESFGKFREGCSIVYTTHSHHMINPNWLEGTYVVKNEGLDYESAEDQYSAKKTVITLEKYRKFASMHPDQQTYFQPVLDVLNYCPSKLETVPDVVMVEGKNDFYTMNYFHDKVLEHSPRLAMMPGGGAGTLDSVIRMYLGWGRNFLVLLDSDAEGVKQKKRYEELFGHLVSGRILTLEDIDPAWKKKRMEDLLTKNDLELIQSTAYQPSGEFRFNKTHFNRAIQELHLTDKSVTVSQDTKDAFSKLYKGLQSKL